MLGFYNAYCSVRHTTISPKCEFRTLEKIANARLPAKSWCGIQPEDIMELYLWIGAEDSAD